MKKNLSKLTALFMCLIMFVGTFSAIPADELPMIFKARAEDIKLYYGDVNRDGKVTATDARAVLRFSVKLEDLDEPAKRIGDMNGDEKITATDARLILRVSVRLDAATEFKGDALTQSQWLKMLQEGFGYQGYSATVPEFDGLTEDNELYECVKSAYEWGAIDDSFVFSPDSEIDADFAAATLLNIIGVNYTNAKSKAVSMGILPKSADGFITMDVALEAITAAKDAQDDEQFETYSNIEVKDEVIDIMADEAMQESDIEYTFTSDVEIEEGDIFIYDNVVARKVVSVTENPDGSKTVETQEPYLTEVFDEFAISDNITTDNTPFEFVPADGFAVVGSAPVRTRSAENNTAISLSASITSSGPNKPLSQVVKTSSDWHEALNHEYVDQLPDTKKLLEDYNELVTGRKPNGELESKRVENKYDYGWSVTGTLSIQDVAIKCDLKKLWKTGEYTFGAEANITGSLEFNGKIKVGDKIPVGTVMFTKSYQKLFMKYGADIFLEMDANGDIKYTLTAQLDQEFTGKFGQNNCKKTNNSYFDYKAEANIHVDGAVNIKPFFEALGVELAYMELRVGFTFDGNVTLIPLVIFKNEHYIFEGNYASLPSELKESFMVCLNIDIAIPIITLKVSAGKDIKDAAEKLKKKAEKKGEELYIPPLDYTFNICTDDKEAFIKPTHLEYHYEYDSSEGMHKVKKCTKGEIDKLAEKIMGRAVDENGKPVEGVTITIKNDDFKSEPVTSDSNGDFTVKFVPYGEYKAEGKKDSLEGTISCKIQSRQTNIGDLHISAKYGKLYADFLAKNKGEKCFTLIYLDNDDIPEMISGDGNGFHYACPTIYTIKDGKVIDLGSYGVYATVFVVPGEGCVYLGNTQFGYEGGSLSKLSNGAFTTVYSWSNDESAYNSKGEYRINGKLCTKSEYYKAMDEIESKYMDNLVKIVMQIGEPNIFENTSSVRTKLAEDYKPFVKY